MLEQRKAVNILDLGTMYIAMKCSAKGKNDVSNNGKFCIKFSPTQIAQDTVNSLNVDKVVYVDNNPEITTITDLSTGKTDQTISKGKPVAIFGSKLKLGSSGSGIYFAPATAPTADGEISYDLNESTWISVSKETIFRNKPAELNFFVPETLESEKSYCIIIKTNYLSNTQSRKDFVETVNSPITVM